MEKIKKKKLLNEINRTNNYVIGTPLSYPAYVMASLHAIELYKKGLRAKDLI